MNPGERLHKYTIIRELGRGGMGGVYVAEEDGTGRQLAIKTLFKRFAEDEAYVRRFQREAQVYRQMDHPHIVHYIESGFDNGTYFIVLEYVKGKTLGEIMHDQGRLDPVPALKICIALAEALKHAHDKGIVHRDLKPSNVLIDESGEVKLLDFGVAHKDDQLVRTQEGTVVGTYFYAAPEQNQGKKDIDNRTDLYTLGIVFYEMLGGRRPFEGDLLEVAAEQARESYARLEDLVPDIPTFLPPIVRRMMAKNMQDRYQNGGELLEELRAALTALTTRRGPPPNLGVRPGAQVVQPGLDDVSSPGALPPVNPVAAPAPSYPGMVQAPGVVSTPAPSYPAPSVTPPAAGMPAASAVSMEPPQPVPQPTVQPIVQPVQPAAAPAPAAAPLGTGTGDKDTRWHAALEAFQKRQLDQAQSLCEAVIAAAPGFAQGHGLLGKIHSAKGYTYNAIEAFKVALTQAPQDVQLHMDYAMSLYTMKLPQKAMEAFEAVLVLDPKNMLAVRYLDLLKHSGGDVSAPVPGSAPAADPGRPDVMAALGGYDEAPAAAPMPSASGINPVPAAVPAAAPAPSLGQSSLYGDVYNPVADAAPAAAPAPAPPAAEPGGASAMNRLDAFFSAPSQPANASPVSMTPPPVSMSPPPVSAAPPAASAVSIPPPVQMPGSTPAAPPVPTAAEVPIAGSVTPPAPQVSAAPPPPKRTPEYMERAKAEAESEVGGEERPISQAEAEGARFAEKKKRRKKSAKDEVVLDPDRAWWLTSVWWGLGAAYMGRRGKAFILTILEVMCLSMVLLPLLSEDVAEKIMQQKVNFKAVADWMADFGLIGYGGTVGSELYKLQDSFGTTINGFILEFGPDALMAFGGLLFFWMEWSIPSAYHREAQFLSLTGHVLEVRRDMSLKISLGEERGVQEGMIFRVEKKKHVDALSHLNFRTMIMAPQVFPIGEAKVVSTTPTFAICKFKRYQGQSSSPSTNDRVVILRES